MMKDTIRAVEDAERQAADAVKAANEEGRRMLEAAGQEAQRLKTEAQEAVRAADVKLESSLAAEGEEYLADAQKRAQEEADLLKRQAEQRMPEVAERVVRALF